VVPTENGPAFFRLFFKVLKMSENQNLSVVTYRRTAGTSTAPAATDH
jgi:hypothetical protein